MRKLICSVFVLFVLAGYAVAFGDAVAFSESFKKQNKHLSAECEAVVYRDGIPLRYFVKLKVSGDKIFMEGNLMRPYIEKADVEKKNDPNVKYIPKEELPKSEMSFDGKKFYMTLDDEKGISFEAPSDTENVKSDDCMMHAEKKGTETYMGKKCDVFENECSDGETVTAIKMLRNSDLINLKTEKTINKKPDVIAVIKSYRLNQRFDDSIFGPKSGIKYSDFTAFVKGDMAGISQQIMFGVDENGEPKDPARAVGEMLQQQVKDAAAEAAKDAAMDAAGNMLKGFLFK